MSSTPTDQVSELFAQRVGVRTEESVEHFKAVRDELATLEGHASRDVDALIRAADLKLLKRRLSLSPHVVSFVEREQREADARSQEESAVSDTAIGQTYTDKSRAYEARAGKVGDVLTSLGEALHEMRSERTRLVEEAAMLGRMGIVVVEPPDERELLRRLGDQQRERLRSVGRGTRQILVVISE